MSLQPVYAERPPSSLLRSDNRYSPSRSLHYSLDIYCVLADVSAPTHTLIPLNTTSHRHERNRCGQRYDYFLLHTFTSFPLLGISLFYRGRLMPTFLDSSFHVTTVHPHIFPCDCKEICYNHNNISISRIERAIKIAVTQLAAPKKINTLESRTDHQKKRSICHVSLSSHSVFAQGRT